MALLAVLTALLAVLMALRALLMALLALLMALLALLMALLLKATSSGGTALTAPTFLTATTLRASATATTVFAT